MDIEIINVMGIERAVLPLDTGIKLVVGLNAAGKSSLLECIAAAATEDSALRNRAKKDTAAMLREGSAAGSIPAAASTPRRRSTSRSRSTARATRFSAASSLTPSRAPSSRFVQPSK